jgi:hypothetical protein
MRSFLIGMEMIGATALLILAGSARAEELERFAGLVCKTPDGIKAVFALHEAETDTTVTTLMSEIKAVNEKEGSEDCKLRNIMAQDSAVVETFHWRNSYYDVKRINVWADCNEGFCVFSKGDDAYVASENHDPAA